jgi:argininosuccinate synthase
MVRATGKKVVLAYSGGLDTSVILKWLIEEGHEVVAYVADVGQREDFEAVARKAREIGASRVYVEDLKEELVRDYVFPMIQAGALYEGVYMLGTAVARPLIARRQIEIAAQEKTFCVSHGATGKGNDQVRFELAYYALEPRIEVIAPWKMRVFLERFAGRRDLIEYAEARGLDIKSTLEKPYSEDENLFHVSHEAGILEEPEREAPEHVYSRTAAPEEAPDTPAHIEITFQNGVPVAVRNLDDQRVEVSPLPLFEYLNELGSEHGIGRIDIVENRFVGIKSRGIYETPGGTILYAAHRDIEGIAMDREVMRLRDMLSTKVAELIYDGFWFSPEMEFLRSAIDKSQELIDGTVRLKLYKGSVRVTGRQSPSSLYDRDLSSMDVEGGFDQEDAAGFIKINAIRLMAHRAITRRHANGGTKGKAPMRAREVVSEMVPEMARKVAQEVKP